MDKLIVLVVLVVVIALSGCMEDVIRVHDTYNLTYINASNISYSGLVNVNGNISNISEINNGNWSADESNTPFWINITFTNITHFDFPEIKMLYYSTVGASAHVNDIEIYCVTENAFVDLTTFTNQIEWTYWTRHIPDSMHFIDANGNVTIRLNHTANGNTNHRIKLDVVRLVEQPQFETVTTTLTQYFNTTTTGGGGGISFDGNPVNANGSTIYNATYIGSMNYTNITNAPRFEQLIYQNHTCCFNRSFINLTGLSINNDSFYKVYSVMNSTAALTLDMYINNDINSSNYSREYVFAAGATLISAYDLSTNISVNSAGESGQSRVLLKRAWNGKTRAIIEGNFDTLVFFNMQLTYNVPVDDVHTINFRFTPATPTGLDMDVYALR